MVLSRLSWLVAAAYCVTAEGLEVDVEDFGAVPDNTTLSSGAINKALQHVSAQGGGVVHARAKHGIYRVAGIELQSHTELRIASGVTLYASDAKEDWTPRAHAAPEACGGDYVEKNTRGGVFFAVRQRNFSITGGGHINGGGAVWNNDREMRNHFLVFSMCSDVVVEDLRITNSSQWTLRPMWSQRLTFRRLRIEGDPTGPNHHNTDGFDPWGCKDASFTDSYYEAGDDCVAVKSGKNGASIPQDTGACGVPSENIYVNNVTCKATHGLTIGSEISGGIRNVTFTNIQVDTGMPIKIKGQCGRGSYVRDILYENITGGSGVDTAVWIDMQYSHGPSDCSAAGTPAFDNITVRNVHVKKAKTAFSIVGLKIDESPKTAPIQGLTLENIVVKKYKSLGSCTHANLTVLGGVSPAVPAGDGTCTIAGKAPAPTPAPTPSGCDATACLDRCGAKYGKVAAGKKGYYCGKGCAGAKSGKVTDLDKFCKLDPALRQHECESQCSGASSSADKIAACKYGCEYWTDGQAVIL